MKACWSYAAALRRYEEMILRSARRIISPNEDDETSRDFDNSPRPARLGYSKNPEANAYSINRRWRAVSFPPSEIFATLTTSALIPWLPSFLRSFRSELLPVIAMTQSTVPSCFPGDASGQVKQKQFTSAMILHMVESFVATTPRILPRLVFTICVSSTFSSFLMKSTISSRTSCCPLISTSC